MDNVVFWDEDVAFLANSIYFNVYIILHLEFFRWDCVLLTHIFAALQIFVWNILRLGFNFICFNIFSFSSFFGCEIMAIILYFRPCSDTFLLLAPTYFILYFLLYLVYSVLFAFSSWKWLVLKTFFFLILTQNLRYRYWRVNLPLISFLTFFLSHYFRYNSIWLLLNGFLLTLLGRFRHVEILNAASWCLILKRAILAFVCLFNRFLELFQPVCLNELLLVVLTLRKQLKLIFAAIRVNFFTGNFGCHILRWEARFLLTYKIIIGIKLLHTNSATLYLWYFHFFLIAVFTLGFYFYYFWKALILRNTNCW